MEGILIGDKHTWNDWNLYLQSYHVPMPDPKQNRINLPGVDGVADFTDHPNGTTYQNRVLTLEFEYEDRGYSGMSSIYTKIASEIQGKKLRVVFDDDSGYYYIGRCTIDSNKINEMTSSLTIVVDADPFKYENNVGNDWLWDPFDFENGIIREYDSIKVTDSYSLLIPGCDKKVIPIMEVTSSMTVEYLGKTYQLSTGKNKIYEIVLGKGDHQLVFKGTGTITITYIGGML